MKGCGKWICRATNDLNEDINVQPTIIEVICGLISSALHMILGHLSLLFRCHFILYAAIAAYKVVVNPLSTHLIFIVYHR